MPVYRPTASSIWNSFLSSGKRHLFLTGSRGSGKTTLLSTLFEQTLPGLTTWAEPGKAVWLKENTTENMVQVGVFDATRIGQENRMAVCRDGFLTLGIDALHRAMDSESQWAAIDEIGYLETECEEYCNAVRKLLEKKQVAAVIRKQEIPFLQELCGRDDAFVVDLDQPFGKGGCIIMASGLGKRFGGNKLMADFLGKPMIEYVLDATEGLFAKRVVVTRHADVVRLCEQRNVDVVFHDLPHRSDTVRLGMEALGDVDSCMFCPADQPLLRRETVEGLLHCALDQNDRIWRTCSDGLPGSPVIFPKWAFEELKRLPEGKGGSWVLKEHPDQVAMMEVSDVHELMDVDTPDALELLKDYSVKVKYD